MVKPRANDPKTIRCICGGTTETLGTLKNFKHYHCTQCNRIIHIKQKPNYQLTDFSPKYYNVRHQEIPPEKR